MASVNDLWYRLDKDTGSKVRTARHGRGRRWRVTWYDNSGRSRSESFARKRDADRRAAKVESDKMRGEYIDPKLARTTVAEWCRTWLEGYATRRASTVRQARHELSHICREFGSWRLAAVRPSDVRTWTARLQEQGYAQSYVYSLHARLRQLMSDAVHDGLLTYNPCSRRTSPGMGRQRPYVATTEQIWALHDALPERYRAAVLLGAFAGLRIAEVCGLRPGDVDTAKQVIRPVVQYPADPLKTETSRTPVPIPDVLASVLADHAARFSGETFIMNASASQPHPATLSKVFREARGRVSDLPEGFRFQDLRHYFASLLIASGADVKAVQARVRHASAKTTLDTYGHLWPDSDRATKAAVAAVFTPRQVYPPRTGRQAS